MGRKTVLAALVTGIAGISLATATSASAQIYGPESCANGTIDIYRGSQYQCFAWDGVQGGTRAGSYLLVNDWYDGVDAGIYKLTVSWHDTYNGQWHTDYIGPGSPWSHKPTRSSMLYSVTFNS